MNIKTKSIITLCLTALASMPLSAQCYMGSVVDIDGTWTTAENIKVEESQIVFTDYNGAEHTISNSHGNSTLSRLSTMCYMLMEIKPKH